MEAEGNISYKVELTPPSFILSEWKNAGGVNSQTPRKFGATIYVAHAP